MSDTHEPAVPGTPPAAPPPPPSGAPAGPPPPTGQPVGQPGSVPPGHVQPGYAQPGYPVAPAPARSTGKFVAGLILTIIGGLWTLGGLANVAIAAAAFADNPGYAAGRIVGGVLLPVAVLVVGIVLLRASKPKV
jgi:hypothetical protein